MSIQRVSVKNRGALKGIFEIEPNGNSFFMFGDYRKGKTTILEVILSHLGLIDYPTSPLILSDGEESGYTELEWKDDETGKVYYIARKYKMEEGKFVLDRFRVTCSDGSNFSQKSFLENVVYKSFARGTFDYYKFFIESKTSETRFKYLIDSIGCQEILDNNKLIIDYEKERAVTGQQRIIQRNLWEEKIREPNNIENDAAYYKEEKKPDDAKAKKQKKLEDRIDIVETTDRYNEIKNKNELYKAAQTGISALKQTIAEKEEELATLKRELEFNENSLLKIKLNEGEELRLKGMLENAKKINEEIEKQADSEYDSDIASINLFNLNRKSFVDGIVIYRIWEGLDKEWNSIDEKIKSVKQKNKEIFSSKIPIKELSIADTDKGQVVMYNGKEFSMENLSKGETIKIAMQIQKAINPDKFNFIVIPEGQSLGSGLYDIIKECKDFNIQACIEYTDMDEPFRMEFVDDTLAKKGKK